MSEQELSEIEKGLSRWHVVSTQTAQRLIEEIKRLKTLLKEEA